MIYTVSSRDSKALVSLLEIICRETLHFCYRPLDLVEPILSLAWAETLQFTPVECIKDTLCASKVIDMFGVVVQKALTSEYVYTIDIENLKKVFVNLRQLLTFLQSHPY
ncbi:MAG: hypothetical protein QXJ95_02510 [Ignisphaera sp.]